MGEGTSTKVNGLKGVDYVNNVSVLVRQNLGEVPK